jgi:[ribosomal protein S5]-alanine N-acetyltransferase
MARPAIHLVRWESVEPAVALDLHLRNREHFGRWSPAPPPGFHTLDGQRARSLESANARAGGRGADYAIVESDGGAVVGTVGLTTILRGALQTGDVGYNVDATRCGRGYATEAVCQLLRIAFGELRLHRVQAAVMPSNAASLRVLARNGFREEGLALRYLCINGAWEDHRILARTVEDGPGR